MGTSSFRMPGAKPSDNGYSDEYTNYFNETVVADFAPIVYPDNLLASKTYDQQEKVVPFVGFYILVPKNARAVADQETIHDAQSSQYILERKLTYASEVNKESQIGRGLGGLEDIIVQIGESRANVRIYRRVNLLKRFICLYMPDTFNSDLNAAYSTISSGKQLESIASLIELAKTGYQAGKDGGIGNALKSVVSSDSLVNAIAAQSDQGGLLGQLGGIARFVQARQGTAINPLTEAFFDTIQFRQFNMDFKFMPKSAKEAEVVKDIIKTFRMYMVPEINKEQSTGVFLSVPAFFQIKYYLHKDGNVTENENIPKISGCVLTGVNTDWAPDGFAIHKDGMPVVVRVQLNFTELEIMHRDRIKQGY